MPKPSGKRIGTRGAVLMIVLFWGALAVVIAVAIGLVHHWGVQATPNLPAGALENRSQAPLETAPQPALARYLKEKQQLIDNYAWIDQKAGIARIPVDVAMRAMTEEAQHLSPVTNAAPAGDSEPPVQPADSLSPEHPTPTGRAAQATDLASPKFPAPARRPLSTSTGGFIQNLGVPLPLEARFQDEQGNTRNLGDFFHDTPIILVLGYYHCPRLCSTIMDGILESVQDLKLPYAIVGISIDPRETPSVARRKHQAYANANLTAGVVAADIVPANLAIDAGPQPALSSSQITSPPPRQRHSTARASSLQLLTGKEPAIERVAQSVGFAWKYDAPSDEYTHPAGFIVATPDGHISRYFPGMRFDRRDVRLALIEASDNLIGTLADRLTLLCSHYDPVAGRYNIAIMRLMRIFGVSLVIMLLLLIWRLHRRSRRRQ